MLCRSVGGREGNPETLPICLMHYMKSAAVQDDEPSLLDAGRRAASFDTSQPSAVKPSPSLRPASFDSRMSAFSPVDVPRLLVHSPASPLAVEPPPQATDSRLLTVPSPDYRKMSCESPKASDYITMGLAPAILGQLTAIASTMITPNAVEEVKPPPIQNMDCSTSLEPLTSSSLDLPLPSGICQEQVQLPQASAELLAQMPAKSVIQDDIRSGNGRFQLVRKRGRSEVWNLFGQVLDTLTNVRLPYVACYACKVLYTDTGGGTGNMTRHRCPIGLSYRSSAHGSSTETMEPGQQSSFESTVSGLQRITEQRPTLSLTINSESSSSAQLISQTSGEVSIGDVDREVLTDSIVKCCALDLIDPDIFTGKGFRALLDRMWQLSKRSGTSPHDVFPDTQMLQSALQTNLRFCMEDLKNELSRTSQGVCLAIESLSYYDKDFRVVHGSRISHDWKWRSNVLGVFKARENQSMAEIINVVVHNYELDRNLLRITCAKGGEEFAPAKAFPDLKEKLREVLHAVLSSCSVPVLQLIQVVDQIMKAFADSDVRPPFPLRCCGDDIFNIYSILRDFNYHYLTIGEIIQSKLQGLQPCFASLNADHLRELEEFLGPFQETFESLAQEQPNFHKVLPEWYALMHECHPSSEEISPLLRELKTKASELLVREQSTTITVEHRIAAIFNPRHNRKLNLICTDHERSQACERIRALCGIRTQREPLSRDSSCEGEPHRKRRLFLNSLEDDPVGDDELECYLRSQYPAQQTRDVVSFWSTVGQAQFPSLASLARRILSVPALAPKTTFDERHASVQPEQLHTFLMLRSMFDTEREE
ncbi:hypothetical protein Y032_0264g614 [Ancylostoma ceylanicum]|uniref:BED-type domain-containing protein n=2 Tax=Ancylostoma TaxID=29169 RepID=A0A016S9J8_9BILA|nr:hypothetical protein Y032_0264g614 [Ancylostoma ceylanicum]